MTATTLERAAGHASARGATVAAAELFEQARRLTTAHRAEDLHRRTLAAARYRFAVGEMGVARRLFEDALAAARAGAGRAEALAGLGFVVAFEGDQPRAAELSRRALEEGGEERARASAARVLSTALMFMREELETARGYASLAVECAERQGDEALVASCLGAQGTIETLLGLPGGRTTCEAAVALESASHEDRIVSSPEWNLAVVLVWTDELAEAEALGRECYDRAVALGDEGSVPLILAQLAIVAYETGRWGEARQLADEGLEVALQTGQRPQQAFSLAARALLDASIGIEREAREDAQKVLALAGERAMAVSRINAVRALGLLELSLDRPEEAARLLAPHRLRLIAAGIGEPASIRFVADEIEALIGLGRLDEADTLLGWLEERGHALQRTSALAAAGRCRGLLLAARHDQAPAFAAFEQALAAHGRIPMPFERARTLLALGAAQRRAKRKRNARETLGEALATFEQLGARIWAERTRAELGRIGGRAPADGGLTPSEQRIAALVAEGRTNREVAAALFISDRTVESHLSHVYRKLGIRTRAALARHFSA
jgi:DNA-binding CsgD family transcriptional regulator